MTWREGASQEFLGSKKLILFLVLPTAPGQELEWLFPCHGEKLYGMARQDVSSEEKCQVTPRRGHPKEEIF